jgi:hypothetical protein
MTSTSAPKVDPVTLSYPDIVTRVSAKAGAAIVFTEYMMHTTYPWTGRGQRKSVFYKYSAGLKIVLAPGSGTS